MDTVLLDIDKATGTAMLEGPVQPFRAEHLTLETERVPLLYNFSTALGSLIEYEYDRGDIKSLYVKCFVPDYKKIEANMYLVAGCRFDEDASIMVGLLSLVPKGYNLQFL